MIRAVSFPTEVPTEEHRDLETVGCMVRRLQPTGGREFPPPPPIYQTAVGISWDSYAKTIALGVSTVTTRPAADWKM